MLYDVSSDRTFQIYTTAKGEPKAAFTPDTCSRLQVFRTSNLYLDTSGYMYNHDNFFADTGYMYRRRQANAIQMDTTLQVDTITCILSGLHVSGVNEA